MLTRKAFGKPGYCPHICWSRDMHNSSQIVLHASIYTRRVMVWLRLSARPSVNCVRNNTEILFRIISFWDTRTTGAYFRTLMKTSIADHYKYAHNDPSTKAPFTQTNCFWFDYIWGYLPGKNLRCCQKPVSRLMKCVPVSCWSLMGHYLWQGVAHLCSSDNHIRSHRKCFIRDFVSTLNHKNTHIYIYIYIYICIYIYGRCRQYSPTRVHLIDW